jgi:hypothetical protein
MELTGIPKEAFTSCFQDFQKRWQQRIDCGGNYFEGDRKHLVRLNFVFFTDSVSELYGQGMYIGVNVKYPLFLSDFNET